MNDSPRPVLELKKDRRGLLALIGAGGAATVAALLGRNHAAQAASGDPLVLGTDNAAGDPTRLDAPILPADPSDPNPWVESFRVQNLSRHPRTIAIAGVSHDAYGVVGAAMGTGTGVHGKSESGAGVSGGSFNGTGVWAESPQGVALEVAGKARMHADVSGHSLQVENYRADGLAVVGISQDGYAVVGAAGGVGTGVHGKSERGAGVNGVCRSGPGVVGEAPGEFPGVRAESRAREEPYDLDGGVALEVVGKARFSTCGAGTVPQGQNAVFVANAAVTGASHITVTLAGDPGSRQLRWVERAANSGFRVHLTPGRPKPATGFTYLVVEPGGP